MAISSPVEWRPRSDAEAGFTLFEMIVALAVSAVFVASLTGLSRTISPRVELRATAERVGGDLERARLEARRTGAQIEVKLSRRGYEIPALELSGDWGEAELAGETARGMPRDILFSPAPFTAPPDAIELTQQGVTARVVIAAISGRVEVRLAET